MIRRRSITMTPEQVEALVDARIAEREAKAKAVPAAPNATDPAGLPAGATSPQRGIYSYPLPQEVAALFLQSLKDADGDPRKAATKIYGKPPYQPPSVLDVWRGCSWTALDIEHREQEFWIAHNTLKKLDYHLRHAGEIAADHAERMRWFDGIFAGMRWLDDLVARANASAAK